jgi:hypothetical protein
MRGGGAPPLDPLTESDYQNIITKGLMAEGEKRTQFARSEAEMFAVAGDMAAGKFLTGSFMWSRC